MKQGYIQILDLDFEYKLWKNKISFMLTEVDLLLDRIHVLKREYVDMQVDDSFIQLLNLQLESLKSANNSIRTQEQEMAFYAEDYPILENHSHYVTHEHIRCEMEKVMNRHNEIFSDIYPVICYPVIKEQV